MDLLSDCVADLLYYDRKGDEELPPGVIEAAVAAGEISIAEMVEAFGVALERGIREGR
jgi:hypothetical protein